MTTETIAANGTEFQSTPVPTTRRFAEPAQLAADVDPRHARILAMSESIRQTQEIQEQLAQAGFQHVLPLSDARRTAVTAIQHRPDLVLLDESMIDNDGLDPLQVLREINMTNDVPIVLLTASSEQHVREQALERGATEFLSKPIDPSELAVRVRICLLAFLQQKKLQGFAQQLEWEIERRTSELVASRRHLIQCLAQAAEFRDDESGRHVIRVGRYAAVIARELGFTQNEIALIEQAAQLHDVGKIGLPDGILLKEGKLTPEEYNVVQRHCQIGRAIIEPMAMNEYSRLKQHAELGAELLGTINSPVLKMASRIALTHHERWDGSGYPLGLSGEDIPLEGRITAVADVYDALSSRRSYKKPLPRNKCLEIMSEGRGTHFDPKVLDAFACRGREIVEIQLQYSDAD